MTLSYVVHQSTVTEEDVSAWSEFIANQVHKMERSPEVLITTAIAPSLAHRLMTPLLQNQLEDRGVQVEETAENLRVRLRYPPSHGPRHEQLLLERFSEVPISWSPGAVPTWPNVSVRHWRVSNG